MASAAACGMTTVAKAHGQETVTNRYDALGRLSSVGVFRGPSRGSAVRYDRDAAGKRTLVDVKAGGGYSFRRNVDTTRSGTAHCTGDRGTPERSLHNGDTGVRVLTVCA